MRYGFMGLGVMSSSQVTFLIGILMKLLPLSGLVLLIWAP